MIPTVRRNVPAKIKAFNSQFAFLKQPWSEMTPKQIADTFDIFHGQSPEMLPEGRLFRVSPGGGVGKAPFSAPWFLTPPGAHWERDGAANLKS